MAAQKMSMQVRRKAPDWMGVNRVVVVRDRNDEVVEADDV